MTVIIKGLEIISHKNLIHKIGKDYCLMGDLVIINDKSAKIVPKYVFYDTKTLKLKNLKGKQIVKIDKNSFGYSDNIQDNSEIKRHMVFVEMLSNLNEKVRAIKLRHDYNKKLRNLNILQEQKKIKSAFTVINFVLGFLSIVAGVGVFNSGLGNEFFYILLIVMFLNFAFYSTKTIEDRVTFREYTIDKIIIDDEYENLLVVEHANVLKITWDNRPPTIHLLIDKLAYSKWLNN